MFVGNPPTPGCTYPMRARDRLREVWHQVSNPLALSLLGLALTVTLWGYAYRLSQYTNVPCGSQPRLLAPRLWNEQRFGLTGISSDAAFLNFKARVYAHPGGSAAIAAAPAFSVQSVSGVPLVAARPRVVPLFDAAIPLRSPPFDLLI